MASAVNRLAPSTTHERRHGRMRWSEGDTYGKAYRRGEADLGGVGARLSSVGMCRIKPSEDVYPSLLRPDNRSVPIATTTQPIPTRQPPMMATTPTPDMDNEAITASAAAYNIETTTIARARVRLLER